MGIPSQQADRSVSLGRIAWCRRWVTASKAAPKPLSQGLDCSRKARPGSERDTPDEETNDWRAVCGRTARTVRREGGESPPYPYRRDRARRYQNFNAFVGDRRASLEPALHVPTWMAGTSPAMTEPYLFNINTRISNRGRAYH